MKEIQLTRGYIAIIDDKDFDELSKYAWSARVMSDGRVYAWRSCLTSELQSMRLFSIGMHRQIMDCPKGMHVDHRDGDTLNNTKSNLRICTNAENSRNSKAPKNNTTGFKGVSIQNGRIYGRIKFEGRDIHLGRFDSIQDAAIAYDEAAIKYFGEFARLNFPQTDNAF